MKTKIKNKFAKLPIDMKLLIFSVSIYAMIYMLCEILEAIFEVRIG